MARRRRGSAKIERNPRDGKLQVVKESKKQAEYVSLRGGKRGVLDVPAEGWGQCQKGYGALNNLETSSTTSSRGGAAGYQPAAVPSRGPYAHSNAPPQHHTGPYHPRAQQMLPPRAPAPASRSNAYSGHAEEYYTSERARGRSMTPSLASHVSSHRSSVSQLHIPTPPRSHVSAASQRSHALGTELVAVEVEYEPSIRSHVSSRASGSVSGSRVGSVKDRTHDSGFAEGYQCGSSAGGRFGINVD